MGTISKTIKRKPSSAKQPPSPPPPPAKARGKQAAPAKRGKRPPTPLAKARGKKLALPLAQKRGPKPKAKTSNSKLKTQNPTPPSPSLNGRGNELEQQIFREVAARRPQLGRYSPLMRDWFEMARKLFVEQGLSLDEITRRQLVKPTNTTLRKWAKRFGWYEQREARLAGPQGLLPDLELAVQKMVAQMTAGLNSGELPDNGTIDKLTKLLKLVEAASGKAYFAGHLAETLELLTRYLKSIQKPDLAEALAEELTGFAAWALGNKA